MQTMPMMSCAQRLLDGADGCCGSCVRCVCHGFLLGRSPGRIRRVRHFVLRLAELAPAFFHVAMRRLRIDRRVSRPARLLVYSAIWRNVFGISGKVNGSSLAAAGSSAEALDGGHQLDDCGAGRWKADSTRLCVFGAGAIGGYLGRPVGRAPVSNVTLVARGPHLACDAGERPSLADRWRRTRLARVPLHRQTRAELGEQDYVIMALKAHTIASAVESMRPLLGPDTTVVTASNGLPYWYFHGNVGALRGTTLASIDPGGVQRDTLGPQRAIGCVVLPAAESLAARASSATNTATKLSDRRARRHAHARASAAARDPGRRRARRADPRRHPRRDLAQALRQCLLQPDQRADHGDHRRDRRRSRIRGRCAAR